MGTHRRGVADAVIGRRKAKAAIQQVRRTAREAAAKAAEQEATDQQAVDDLRRQLDEPQ